MFIIFAGVKNDLLKKLIFLIYLVFPLAIFAQSQGSLNIISENGDNFYLYLDGKKQNDIARSNIRIQGVPDLFYSAKIVFADSSIPSISKNNLYVSDVDDIMRDAYYRIKHEKGGKPKLVFYAMLTAQQNFVPAAGIYVFKFGEPSVAETIAVEEIKEVIIPVTADTKLGSLNVFSQNGDKFFLFLNGVKQNDVAQSNIRINNIPGPYYNVKIVFKDSKTWPISKNNVFVSDGDDNLMDAVYRIRRDKTGRPRFNFYSMTDVNPGYKVPAGMYVYNFGKPANSVAKGSDPVTKNTFSNVKGTITNVKVVTKEDPSSKTTAPKTNIAANTKTKPVTKSPGETTTPVSKTPAANNKTTETSKVTETAKEPAENKKCNGWPMGKGDLAVAKRSIEDAGKEEEKLKTAEEIIASNCLLSSQVTEFCTLFKSEKTKLAFAKYAYKFTIDRKNYAEVNKALTLETSKKELNKFINGG